MCLLAMHTVCLTNIHSPTYRVGGSNTLPKRKSENALGETSVKGRMLPGETQPRSGSWNSHTRNAKAVLPNKYSATPPAERAKSANVSDEEKARRNSPVSAS